MNKFRLILIILFLFSLGVNTVFADVPSLISLEVADGTDGRIMDITIRHNSPTNVHYINEIEVKVGDYVKVFELEPQSDTTFTEQVSVAANGDVL
jgi:ribosomal protein S17